MNLSDLVPKFRFEIRRAGATKRDPWQIAELAHTQNQVTAMTPHWKNNPDIEFRVVDNLPAAPQPVRLDPPAPVASAIPPAPVFSLATPQPSAAAAPSQIATEVPTAAAPVLAELPFKSGDRLQDKNVADHPPLHVAEINPDGRHGFNVECPEIDHPVKKWFVAANAAHNFHLFHAPKAHTAAHAPAKKKATAKKPAAKKKTAPKHKPAAAHS